MTIPPYLELKDSLTAWRPEAEWSRPKEVSFGLFSTSLAFREAKVRKIAPITAAEELAASLREYLASTKLDRVLHVAVAGPYLNVGLTDAALAAAGKQSLTQPLVKSVERTVMLEYIGANVAKSLHAGHMRNLNIGESLRRLLAPKYGAGLITDNHWGDWGVQFGILLWAYHREVDVQAYKDAPMDELQRLYVWGNAQKETHPNWNDEVRAEFVKLEEGDDENRRLWEEFVRVSKIELAQELPLLNVTPTDLELGESSYEELMKRLTLYLDAQGIWKTEGSARYFDLPELDEDYATFGRCYLISSNGYTTYAYRDVAARLEWAMSYKIETAITVTDKTQAHNFDQAFGIIMWLAKRPDFAHVFGADTASRLMTSKLVHVGYGYLSLTSGKMSTRAGNVLPLRQLVEEVKNLATTELTKRDSELDPVERTHRASVLAVASLKWVDLNRDPVTDVVLDPSQAIAFEGNTGTYQLYTYARLRSVMRRAAAAGVSSSKLDASRTLALGTKERQLISLAYALPSYAEQAATEFRPNLVTTAIAELTSHASHWYETTPILKAEPDLQADLLAVCNVVTVAIKRGLELLAIEVLEEL